MQQRRTARQNVGQHPTGQPETKQPLPPKLGARRNEASDHQQHKRKHHQNESEHGPSMAQKKTGPAIGHARPGIELELALVAYRI